MGSFDTINHGWLVKFIEHRIADRRVVRLIQKWLNAGVLEDGMRLQVEEQTPQGGSAAHRSAHVPHPQPISIGVRALAPLHVTTTVPVPGRVEGPISQVHDAVPLAPAVFDPSP